VHNGVSIKYQPFKTDKRVFCFITKSIIWCSFEIINLKKCSDYISGMKSVCALRNMTATLK